MSNLIGGTDILIDTDVDVETAVRASIESISEVLAQPVLQDPSNGKILSWSKFPKGMAELFIYRDMEALQDWEKRGADQSNVNTMIHLIFRNQATTVIVDDRNASEIQQIISEIRMQVQKKTSPVGASREEIAQWVQDALRSLGGVGTIVQVNQRIWEQHGQEIQARGELFFKWQYEVRWAADMLRKKGVMQPSQRSERDTWRLKAG